MGLLSIFILLQLADMGTTIAAISLGGSEMNPIVARLLGVGVYGGLVIAKLIGLGIAGVAMAYGRYTWLRKANIAFTVIVLWNLSIIGRLMLA
jgi:Domain of unknown function (DUF5658)